MVKVLPAHQPITTKITWNKEVIRIFRKSCLGCHRAGGSAFSLETYEDARAWATAIRDEVLEKRMPPWPAAKGFGEFRNDRSLAAFEIEMIISWAEGGVPRGDPKDLPAATAAPPVADEIAALPHDHERVGVGRALILNRTRRVVALHPIAPEGLPVEVRAVAPDGRQQTLLWIRSFQPKFPFTYWLRDPLAAGPGWRLEVRGSDGTYADIYLQSR